MQPPLTFLHTSPAHVATFDGLMGELAPDVPVRHLVDESLLADAMAAGEVTPALAERIAAAVAAGEGRVIVCTCSTIGGAAVAAGKGRQGAAVLRIDQAMAELAVALGPRITIAATVESTIAPTRALLEATAQRLGAAVSLGALLCEGAWARFAAGDRAGYLAAIAATLNGSRELGDVVVLAQASMAGAAAACANLGVPILSSPRLGVEAALKAYRAAAGAPGAPWAAAGDPPR